MKTSASRWSQEWLPSVMASAPGVQDLVADRLGDAEAAGGVLAVDDDAVELPAVAKPGQALDDRVAAGPPDDVAEKEETHGKSLSRIWSE